MKHEKEKGHEGKKHEAHMSKKHESMGKKAKMEHKEKLHK
jgi:hypothetical protein